MLSAAPKQYHKHLIPKFRELLLSVTWTNFLTTWFVALGCKRVLFNNFGYLESLHKPNVQLIYDGLTEIIEDGVLVKGGKCSVIRWRCLRV